MDHFKCPLSKWLEKMLCALFFAQRAQRTCTLYNIPARAHGVVFFTTTSLYSLRMQRMDTLKANMEGK